MPTIQPREKPLIKAAVGPDVEIVAATMAKVYSTRLRADRWTPHGHEGALLLLKDREVGGLFFRLVALPNARVVWEHEVYFDFEYRLDAAFFHSFESDDGHQVGFLFASEQEANDFAQVVYQKSEILQISGAPNARRGTTSSPRGGSREGSIKSVSSSEKLDGGKAGNRFLGLFRRKENKDKDKDKDRDRDRDRDKEGENDSPSQKVKKKKEGLTADDIGDPTEFRHLAHIGFNQATGTFDVQNIPAEWKEIFHKAGITNAQLENRETAAFIANFVKKNADPSGLSHGSPSKGVGGGKSRGPPPPPPAKTIRGPPPPPPTRRPRPAAEPAHPAPPSLGNSHPTSQTTRPTRAEDQDPAPSMPAPADPSRAQLLASIRSTGGGGGLRPVERAHSSPSITTITTSISSSESPTTGGDQSDIMASMLAKALAERNRRIAHSDSEEDNSEW